MDLSPHQAREALWRRGILDFKLRPHQQDVVDAIRAFRGELFVANLPRQIGKTFTFSDLSVGVASQGMRVLFGTYSLKATKSILRPTIADILSDCPPDMRPTFNSSEGVYRFPGGGLIRLAGFDEGRAENYRGGTYDLVIVDEAGFISMLRYVVKSILYPMLKTTRGLLVLSSSAPPTPGHEFVGLAHEAMANGGYIHKTIYDDTSIRPDDIERIIRECGGRHSPHFRREHLGEFLVDPDQAVLPEFTEGKSELVGEVERPRFFDAYTTIDQGFVDNTGILFGYWHYDLAKLVIEDEVLLRHAHTKDIGMAVREKEGALWGKKAPYRRTCDAPQIVLAELNTVELPPTEDGSTDCPRFGPARKDDKEAAVNAYRVGLVDRRVLIHPQCTHLIAQSEAAIWNRARTRFDRSDAFGHYDMVDAAIYKFRHVARNRNPVPVGYGLDPATMRIRRRELVPTEVQQLETFVASGDDEMTDGWEGGDGESF